MNTCEWGIYEMKYECHYYNMTSLTQLENGSQERYIPHQFDLWTNDMKTWIHAFRIGNSNVKKLDVR